MTDDGHAQRRLPLSRPSDTRARSDRPFRENYNRSSNGRIVRGIVKADGTRVTSSIRSHRESGSEDLGADYDREWLRSERAPRTRVLGALKPLRIADLFSGCGAMTLGLVEACRAIRKRAQPVLAADCDPTALAVYSANFPGATVESRPLETVLDSDPGERLSQSEVKLKELVGDVDILVGGPPCQGHSDLNNRTRRSDPKNALMLRMARCAEVLEPTHIVVENVPAVVHDRGRVVDLMAKTLSGAGYSVDYGFVDLVEIGVPQRRRRFVLLASRNQVDLSSSLQAFIVPGRTVRWAIEDLGGVETEREFDTASVASPANVRRMEYLFKNELFDLPDEQRPPCHRDKKHSYKSVYGRLSWDEPAQTITTGFGSMGQGRFVHPTERRTLTPHEAARIQMFPDYFDFGETSRTALAKLIGNAVPPKLTYVLGLALLAQQ